MEDFKAEIVRIDRTEKHPNADRLDLAFVRGWQVVVRTGSVTAGQLVVYLPIDSVLPPDLEADLFPMDSKIKLTRSRVRTIKIRGAISQGMVLELTDKAVKQRLAPHFALGDGHGTIDIYEGTDVTDILGITKYEPPTSSIPARMGGQKVRRENTYFKQYGKISHFKNYPDLFEEGEEVIVTEKIHGTNFRAGWVPTEANTLWKKVKKFFGLLPEWEFVYGSHHVQLQNKFLWNGYYKRNVYAEAVHKYSLEARIPKGYVVYGEIYGPGIQKGYGYGVPSGEHRLAIFDVMALNPTTNQMEYQAWDSVVAMSETIRVPTVPIIVDGKFRQVDVPLWEQGPSLIGWHPNHPVLNNDPAQPHREGCVVKPRHGTGESWMGRKVLRSINPEYLLINETDFH